MRVLTILRHAKSSWDHPGLSDFDRPLNDRGTGAARRIGEEMKRRAMNFDYVLASPAIRVRETMDRAAEGYGRPFDVRFDERMYMASAGALLAIGRGLPEGTNAPLLVGHNPGLHQLVVNLAEDSRVREKFPTAALAVIAFSVDAWSDIAPGTGRIAQLILPRELGG